MEQFVKKVANTLESPYFLLDRERQTWRVIYRDRKRKEKHLLDFAKLLENNIGENLRKRDFTFNAIAMNLSAKQQWIDPLGGIRDLENRKIVLCNPDSLRDDPIRVIRAVRFHQQLQCKISISLRKN